MNEAKDIIVEYSAADEERRLSMFLTHRDMRRHFTAIEMGEMTGPEKVALNGTAEEKARQPHRFACDCWGWLKHCLSMQ